MASYEKCGDCIYYKNCKDASSKDQDACRSYKE